MAGEENNLTAREKELAKSFEAAKDELRKCDKQVGMVMDLNKCIGCQLCSMACKTLWTNMEGREYMWWTNFETGQRVQTVSPSPSVSPPEKSALERRNFSLFQTS